MKSLISTIQQTVKATKMYGTLKVTVNCSFKNSKDCLHHVPMDNTVVWLLDTRDR